MDDENDFCDDCKRTIKANQDNLNRALDCLIESVSVFKARGSDMLTNIEDEEWSKMLTALDFGKFIVSGLMYSYGMPICDDKNQD